MATLRLNALAPSIALFAVVAACAGGCEATRDVSVSLRRVVPAAAASCGAPADGRTMIITALGEFPPSESTALSRPLGDAAAFSIRSFPAATRVLSVEVLGGAGVVRTVGLTAPFSIDSLTNGAVLPVFMAPPQGFCPTGSLHVARAGPLVARAGAGVLVAGGIGAGGRAVKKVELYDPASGAFEDLGAPLYGDPDLGLTGATITEMPDGKVVIAGGVEPAYQVYDPVKRAFDPARFLSERRAHHAAVATGNDTLLLIGGCSRLESDGSCSAGAELATSERLDIATGALSPGPTLSVPRADPVAVREADGRVLVIGGAAGGTPVTTAERLDPAGGVAAVAGATGGVAAALPGGGVVTAFAGPAGGASDRVAVIPPGGEQATALASAPDPRAGATLTPLADGRLLAFGGGGDAGAEAALYVPAQGAFVSVAAPPGGGASPGRRRDHGAVRLDDGTVLIVGGRGPAGSPLSDAWIFRPELVGPYASDAVVAFGDPQLSQQIVPRDPAFVARRQGVGGGAAQLVVFASADRGERPSEWALVGGPAFAAPKMTVRAEVGGGGIAVMIAFRDAGNYDAVELTPGQPARLVEVKDGKLAGATGCEGRTVGVAALGGSPHDIVAAVAAGGLRVTGGGATFLSCPGVASVPSGLVGVGVLGKAGAEVDVEEITARR